MFFDFEKKEALHGAMKTEILHFTDEPDIKHFAEVKVRKNDNVYGVTWANLVREYLKTAYLEEDKESEVISDGIMYKVLKRKDVTAFYDADGNTLFDVENKRLDREYGLVMDASKELGTECRIKKQIEETAVTPETMAGDKASGVGQAGDGGSGSRKGKADAAKKKYESSLEACKPHEKRYFEGPIKEHMLKRFGEDGGFCEDFLQKHKTFQKCIKYMIEKARASVPQSEMQAMVEGSVYLEWMEDYFRKDDKAEEEEKDRKEAERKEKQKKVAAERVSRAKERPDKAVPVLEKKADAPKEQPKPKKNNRDMDGQLDMFSMMGM